MMLLALVLWLGLCSALPSEHGRLRPRHAQLEHDPSLSLPGVEFHRALPFETAPVVSHGERAPLPAHAPLKRIPDTSYRPRRPSAASLFYGVSKAATDAGRLDSFPAEGFGNVSVVDRAATEFSVEMTLNGKTVSLILDTSHADTWIRSANFTCLNAQNDTRSSSCDWGPAPHVDFSQGSITNQHFAARYEDGQSVSGRLGSMDVSLGGLEVPDQEVAIATEGIWHGNNVTSGVLGMAFPALTSAYSGNDLNDTDDKHEVLYSPFFTSLVQEGHVQPVWMLAINRNRSDGAFGLGEMPPSVDLNGSHTASTDLLIAKLADQDAAAYQYSYYTIVPDGFKLGKTQTHAKYPVIIDSGSTLTYLPPDVAAMVNNAFSTPAVYKWFYGSYFVPCDTIPPRFAVTIGGSQFYMSPKDMINQEIKDADTGYCQTGVTNGQAGPYILGLSFLVNIAVTFNIGEAVISVDSRQYY